ncbi:hypothetical protein KY49_709 [Burkholderia sp. MSHR3999]|uniref:hypothetical protein n=1 Tax=Burkholderia sp. MSHR3999 TaxID=1542965 RepID=UPI0005AC51C4|nr:hypothetical protein [Burkholderia sp. MSHR3999]KIP14013.1 hypothetical protein KY49_709 [Burkholderia sp. MSHR3999]
MIKLDVKNSFDKLSLRLRQFSQDLPYATAQALNTVAFDSQKSIRTDTLPGTFTLRNKRTRSGIQVDKATKQNLTAAVGTTDWWTAQQTEDVTRRAGDEGRESVKVHGKPYLAIPVGGAPSKVIAKGQRASALIAKNQAYVVQLKKGLYAVVTGEAGVAHGIVPLFILKPQVSIKERLHMKPAVDAVIRKRFDERLAAELERIASKAAG